MKVKDLVELLQSHDQNLEVEVFCFCEGTHVTINSVELQNRTDEDGDDQTIVAIVEDE